MALWLDKHRPTTLDKLTLHENLTDRLRKVANSPQFPHMLFYGPPGSGKRTRIMAVLREMFGASAEKLKVEHREFKVRPSAWRARRPPLGASLTPHPHTQLENVSGAVELTVVSSNYHVELNPSDAGTKDSKIVQEVIKEIAQNHAINTGSAARSFKGAPAAPAPLPEPSSFLTLAAV